MNSIAARASVKCSGPNVSVEAMTKDPQGPDAGSSNSDMVKGAGIGSDSLSGARSVKVTVAALATKVPPYSAKNHLPIYWKPELSKFLLRKRVMVEVTVMESCSNGRPSPIFYRHLYGKRDRAMR